MVWFFFIFKFSYGWRSFHTRVVSKSVIQTSCYCVQQLFITYTPGVDRSYCVQQLFITYTPGVDRSYCVQQLFITYTPGVNCSFYIITPCPVVINKSTLVVEIPKMESNILPKFLLYESLDCCRFCRVSRKIKII